MNAASSSLEIHTHKDVIWIIHSGDCNRHNADAHAEQVERAIMEVQRAHNRVAIISDLISTHSIDSVYRHKMTTMARRLQPHHPLHIVILRNPVYRVMVGMSALVIGRTVLTCRGLSEACELARRSAYSPDPNWK